MSSKVKMAVDAIKEQLLNRYYFGDPFYLDMVMTAYLSRGHVLVEGPPGTAKTLTAKLFAAVLAKSFKRIQFTTDLLPADILGANIYLPGQSEFTFIKGPIFSDFIVADEINRAPPRTQSALLEAMEERQVTIEGKRHVLSPDFFVMATQNPQDYEGTFPLPEVQMDRFLFKIIVGHSDEKTELEILKNIANGNLPPSFNELDTVTINHADIESETEAVKIDDKIFQYITAIIQLTRNHSMLSHGSSVRGGIALTKTSRVHALIQGRDFVIPDDVKSLVAPTLRHRIKLNPEAQVAQVSVDDVIKEILEMVPFPE